MCGIAGFFNHRSMTPADPEKVADMLRAMGHRGPDHLGVHADGEAALGAVRLAIQDLSAPANQPMSSADRSRVLVYNGEIYNFPELREELVRRGHTFRTRGDTEVLLHLHEEHGEAMVERLNGMFAFALFDCRRRRLLLGRDRAGQKPLHLAETGEGLLFCSELAPLLPHLGERRLDPAGVGSHLSLGYALEPDTVVAGVRTLEPGTLLALGPEGEEVRTFWRVGNAVERRIDDPGEWLERAAALFPRVLERHLVSDVPVTLFLSGGIDSGLLALFLAGSGRIERAYTGSFADSRDHDEYPYAAALGERCGFPVERVGLDMPALAGALEEFLAGASRPQGDTSALATWCLARAVARDYRVVLGGDGGDDLFGGYPTYTLPWLRRRWGLLPRAALDLARRLAAPLGGGGRYMAPAFVLQQLAQAWGRGVMSHFEVKNFLPRPLAAELLPGRFALPAGERHEVERFRRCREEFPHDDEVRRLCWVDFRTFLAAGTIPKVERNTMRHSLEARLPFLDNEVIDLSIATPSALMVRRRETKLCLKALFRRTLGAAHRANPVKQGFTPPLTAMFRGVLKEWEERWLDREVPFLRPGYGEVIRRWERRGHDLHRLKWHIFSLADWCRRQGVS